MGKKVKRKTYVSKGIHSNVSASTRRLCRNGASYLNKLAAWRSGKSGKITIPNPNKQETNRPFIKVSFESYFGGTFKNIMARVKPTAENDKA